MAQHSGGLQTAHEVFTSEVAENFIGQFVDMEDTTQSSN